MDHAPLPVWPLVCRRWLQLAGTAVLLALVLVLAAWAPPAVAQPTRYTATPASADGIGKRYMGREIAGVMGWQGAAWLERAERDREERTDLLMTALALQPGMVVADIGAGTGYLARRMARAVAPTGRVVAVDVQPQMVRLLQKLADQPGLGNLLPWQGEEQDVRLPEAQFDLAVLVDVYHELAYPWEVLQSVLRALKPGGQLVLVEYKAEDDFVPIKALHKMSVAQVRREAEVHGLVWERTVASLPWQHVVVFRKPR